MSNPGDELLWLGKVLDHDKIMRRFDKHFGPSLWQRFVAWIKKRFS